MLNRRPTSKASKASKAPQPFNAFNAPQGASKSSRGVWGECDTLSRPFNAQKRRVFWGWLDDRPRPSLSVLFDAREPASDHRSQIPESPSLRCAAPAAPSGRATGVRLDGAHGAADGDLDDHDEDHGDPDLEEHPADLGSAVPEADPAVFPLDSEATGQIRTCPKAPAGRGYAGLRPIAITAAEQAVEVAS